VCPTGKNKTLILFLSTSFLLFSLCFGALAYVSHKQNKKLLKKKRKAQIRKTVRKQQTKIKDSLIRIEKKMKPRKKNNVDG
jgi:predicted small secreted protein